jgi:hypothetical protein
MHIGHVAALAYALTAYAALLVAAALSGSPIAAACAGLSAGAAYVFQIVDASDDGGQWAPAVYTILWGLSVLFYAIGVVAVAGSF